MALFSSWKKKLYVLISAIVLLFFLFDLAGLLALNSSVELSDISEYHLYTVKQTLFNLFMLKFLRLFLALSLITFVVYWILKPYWRLSKKIRQASAACPLMGELSGEEKLEVEELEHMLDKLCSLSCDKTGEESPPAGEGR